MATSGECDLLLVFLVLFLLNDCFCLAEELKWEVLKTSGLFRFIKTGQKKTLTGTIYQRNSKRAFIAGSLQLYLKSCFWNLLIKSYLLHKHLWMAATNKVFSLIESQRFSLKTLLFLIAISCPFSFKNLVI